jgi:hypothetical protein
MILLAPRDSFIFVLIGLYPSCVSSSAPFSVSPNPPFYDGILASPLKYAISYIFSEALSFILAKNAFLKENSILLSATLFPIFSSSSRA